MNYTNTYNKKVRNIVIFIVILVLVFLGLFYFNKTTYTTSQINNNQSVASKVSTTVSSEKYIQYSNSDFQNASGKKRVLFFYANWCPTCIPTDADLTTNSSKIPAGVTVIRVNYNDTETDKDEEALAKKYEVTYQHTFVQIDEQGKVLTKWNGGKTSELIANIK